MRLALFSEFWAASHCFRALRFGLAQFSEFWAEVHCFRNLGLSGLGLHCFQSFGLHCIAFGSRGFADWGRSFGVHYLRMLGLAMFFGQLTIQTPNPKV